LAQPDGTLKLPKLDDKNSLNLLIYKDCLDFVVTCSSLLHGGMYASVIGTKTLLYLRKKPAPRNCGAEINCLIT